MKIPSLTERGAQLKIRQQFGVAVKLEHIGVGDYSEAKRGWPVYVSSGSVSPDIYWVH